MLEAAIAGVSFAGFLGFLLPVPWKKWFAVIGWTALVGMLFAHLPEYFAENNIIYPLIAVLALPALWITIQKLYEESSVVFCMTRAAAIGFLIFAPFAYIGVLGDWLIGVNVMILEWFFNILGFQYSLAGWNLFMHDIYRVRIILGCTGIQAMALMLGIAWSVKSTLKQKALAFASIVPAIFVMNLIRNIFVIIAYTEQWFPFLPEIASNGEIGYESYFWAHNIISEFGLSLLTVIIVGLAIITIIPDLKSFFIDILKLYNAEFRKMLGKPAKEPVLHDW